MRLVDIKQLSEFLSVKESTLYSWANGGSMPAYKINGVWRFDMDEIEVWIKKGRGISNPAQRTATDKADNQNIDTLVRKAIDGVKGR